MTIGERIKNRRIELGLSVEEVAKKLGKNRATVYRYEKDDIKDLPITLLEPLAKVLETTPADLMGWGTSKAVASIALCNVHCETEDEANLVLNYRELSESGQKKVYSYTEKLKEIEYADAELNAAHKRTDTEVTEEMVEYDDNIMDSDDF